MSKRFERISQTVLVGLLTVSPMALTAQARADDSQTVRDTVPGGMYLEYKATLVAGQRVTIDLVGDGASDLDLRVYDMNGNLVIEDTRFAKGGSVWFEVTEDVQVVIKVWNKGNRASEFELSMTLGPVQSKQPQPEPKPEPKPEPMPYPKPNPN